MKKRTKTDTPAGYEIRVGYIYPFVVIPSGASGYDPVAAFHFLRDALAAYPGAKISDGAKRKARELGE